MTRLRRQNSVPLVLMLALCALAAGTPATRADDPPVGHKYALLVGVHNYNKDELRSLKYTENDVNDLADVLNAAGYKRVFLMTQSEANKADLDLMPEGDKIRRKLKALLDDRKPSDTVLVAFSGHGVQPTKKGSYFCPMDAKVKDLTTLVSLAEVYKALEESKAGVKVLLVDACRNDPLADGPRDLEKLDLESVTRPQAEKAPSGVAALFSCSEGQKSFDSEKLGRGHGVFFHYLIEGLKGEAQNKKGEVTLDRLITYVKEEVPDAVKDVSTDARQQPQLVGNLSGAVVLVTVPAYKVPPPILAPVKTDLLIDENFQTVPSDKVLPVDWTAGKDQGVVVMTDKNATSLQLGPGGHAVQLPKQVIQGDFFLEWEYDIVGTPDTHMQVRLDGPGGSALLDILGTNRAEVTMLGKKKLGVDLVGKNTVRLQRKGQVYTVSVNGNDPVLKVPSEAVDFNRITFGTYEGHPSEDTVYRIYAVRLGLKP